jgi:hypothetical protein
VLTKCGGIEAAAVGELCVAGDLLEAGAGVRGLCGGELVECLGYLVQEADVRAPTCKLTPRCWMATLGWPLVRRAAEFLKHLKVGFRYTGTLIAVALGTGWGLITMVKTNRSLSGSTNTTVRSPAKCATTSEAVRSDLSRLAGRVRSGRRSHRRRGW